MSTYNTDLQTNNTSLEEILTTINNLPEAGGSSSEPQIFSGILNVTNGNFNVGFTPDVMTAFYVGDNPPSMMHDNEYFGDIAINYGALRDEQSSGILELGYEQMVIFSFLYNKNGQSLMKLLYWQGNQLINTETYFTIFDVATCFSNFSSNENGISIIDGENFTNLNAQGNYYVYAIKYVQ